MRLSVRSKIVVSLMLVALLMIGHGLLSAYVLSTIDRRATRARGEASEVAALVSELLSQTQTVHQGALAYVSAAGQEATAQHASEMRQTIGETEALLERLEEVWRTPAELQKAADFRAAWNTYASILVEQVLAADQARRESLLQNNGAAHVASQEVFSRLDALAQAIRVSADDTLLGMEHQRWMAQSILLGLMLVAAMISALLAMYTASRIGSALSSVRNAARLVAEGDLDWSVTVTTKDEIEDIAESLTKVARRTRQSLATSRETTELLGRQISECRRLKVLLSVEGNRLGALIGMLKQAVIVTNADGRIMFLNQSAAELTAWRREQALGEPVHEVLHLLDEKTGERRPSPADEATLVPPTVRHSKHALLVDKERTEHRIVLDSAPILDRDNQTAGIVIVFHEEVPET